MPGICPKILWNAKYCEVCGNQIAERKGHSSYASKRRFCSTECSSQYHSGKNHPLFGSSRLDMRGEKNPRYRPEIKPWPCLQCGKIFRPRPAKVDQKEGKFCSRNCVNLYGAIYMPCSWCGKELRVHPGRKGKQKRFFCSKKCEGQYKQGPGNPFYGKTHSEVTVKSILAKIHSIPNDAEKKLLEVINSLGLPFKFVGDGSIIIGGLNPDFINVDGKKQIIELFGHGFHRNDRGFNKGRLPFHHTEEGRREVFNKYGFDLLVVWDTELKRKVRLKKLTERLIAFSGGGDENVRNTS